jgi:hypothetical protein
VVDGDAALGHHLLEITQAEAISEIPPHAEQDHLKLIWGIPGSHRHGRDGIMPLTKPTKKRAAQPAILRQRNNAKTLVAAMSPYDRETYAEPPR